MLNLILEEREGGGMVVPEALMERRAGVDWCREREAARPEQAGSGSSYSLEEGLLWCTGKSLLLRVRNHIRYRRPRVRFDAGLRGRKVQ